MRRAKEAARGSIRVWGGDKDALLSTAPPSEPPSAAGNFESFLLHRVIFVTSGTNV